MAAAIALRRTMSLSLEAEGLLLFYFRHTSLGSALTRPMISPVRMFLAKHSLVVFLLRASKMPGTCRVPCTRIRKRTEASGNFSKMS